MSADNWGICPKCSARHAKMRAELVESVDSQYGKIDRVDYKVLEETLAATPEEYDKYELREDYEFYLDDAGNFLADYGAHCANDECDFKFTFRHRETVDFK